jgi:hypothetical protein
LPGHCSTAPMRWRAARSRPPSGEHQPRRVLDRLPLGSVAAPAARRKARTALPAAIKLLPLALVRRRSRSNWRRSLVRCQWPSRRVELRPQTIKRLTSSGTCSAAAKRHHHRPQPDGVSPSNTYVAPASPRLRILQRSAFEGLPSMGLAASPILECGSRGERLPSVAPGFDGLQQVGWQDRAERPAGARRCDQSESFCRFSRLCRRPGPLMIAIELPGKLK